ncbi:CoA-binding protein [Thermogemmatispora sp.]|uniref:CoA-binding protein n=1 Tax=Thermogemmatispora sp. TaxID=1968838 RepID=UPI0035E447FA
MGLVARWSAGGRHGNYMQSPCPLQYNKGGHAPALSRCLLRFFDRSTTDKAGKSCNCLEKDEVQRFMMQYAPDMYDRLKLLQTYRHVAIVGISADPYRPSHFVAIYLQAEGYHIVLVNPRYAGQTILGKRVYASLTEAREAGETIEVVDVFRKPEDVLPIAEEAIRIGAKVLWLQLGIRNDEAGRLAQEAGLIFVQNKCIKMEHARFFGGLHTVGLNTGVILSRALPRAEVLKPSAAELVR